jgi:hypothetical protein
MDKCEHNTKEYVADDVVEHHGVVYEISSKEPYKYRSLKYV